MSEADSNDSETSTLKKFYNNCFGKKKQNNNTTTAPFITLTITNQSSRYRLKHGPQYLSMLESRDHVLQHDFNFKFQFPLESQSNGQIHFIRSVYYEEIVREIKKFLVEAGSNVVSISFKLLNEGSLEEKEAKEYAAKNIMLNVQAVFDETIKAFESNEQLKRRVNMNQIRQDLAIQLDSILKNIMINLADNFPQAPASGATPKMKQVINDVNRSDNEENDLIFANSINIKEYIKREIKANSNQTTYEQICFNEEGYTQFIMKVINTAIEVTQTNQDDYRQRTMRQIFTEFNEKLFWLSQQKKYQPIINNLDQKKLKLQEEKEKSLSLEGNEEKEKTKQKIIQYFDLTLERNRKKYRQLSQNYSNSEIFKKQPKITINGKKSKIFHQSSLSNFTDLTSQSEEGIEFMKKSKTYAIGQKIPPFVKMFTRQDMMNKTITAKHESILRILTKWAEYLQDIFQNPELHIRRRLYPFKNFNNQILRSFQGKQQLILRLGKEYKEVKKKFKTILKSNFGYIGTYLSKKEESSFISNVNRYSQTRTASSKINTILTFLMVSYTCQLIHHLLRAGHHLDNGYGGFEDVNLLVFRVSDLMRSKLQCSQSSFISLLKTIYLLDNSPQMNGKFKLVRIKNKLDDPANNIMINYLFMGKVQCELQLSTQEPKGKAMHNYMFSHFIYELTRGKFGTITELAIMISQLDPMISSCKDNSYRQKTEVRMIQKETGQQQRPEQQLKVRMFNQGEEDMNSARAFMIEQILKQTARPSKSLEQQIRQSIFECILCHKLIIKQNRNIFSAEHHSNGQVCNMCLGKSLNVEELLKDKKMMKALTNEIRRGQIKRIFNYNQLQYLYKSQCILNISENGLLNFSVIIYIESQLKHFWIKIDERILDTIDVPNFDFNSINYTDITQDVIKNFRKGKKFTNIIYSIRHNFTFESEMYDVMNINEKLMKNQLETVIKLFKEFREEKQIIKTIKFKAEIINANHKQEHWKLLDKIGTLLALRESGIERVCDPLKYNKVEELDFTNIKTIEASDLNLKSLPKWLKKIVNLKSLNFRNNSLEDITNDDIPDHVTQLSLENNRLSRFRLTNNFSLTKLDLRSNDLTNIDLSSLYNITHLLLSHNPLGKIDLTNLTNLIQVHLENNNLISLNLENLKQLSRLWLKNNQIQYLDLADAINLEEVNLSSNAFRKINISHLKNLVKLQLKQNPIEQLTLTNLKSLQRLQLNNTPLCKAVLTNLAKLQSLDLRSNKLEIVQLKDLNNLSSLDLNSNPLFNLSLENLTLIKTIKIENTKMMSLKMENLPKISQLRLRKNRLKSISLKNMANLSLLDVGQNCFSNFSLDHLSKLTTLLLDSNELEKINLGYETDLVFLDIRKNKLKKISLYNPDLFKMIKKESLKFDYSGGLNKVKLLFISSNPGLRFDTFPPSLEFLEADKQAVLNVDFEHLINLKELKVRGGKIEKNQIKNLREEVRFESKDSLE